MVRLMVAKVKKNFVRNMTNILLVFLLLVSFSSIVSARPILGVNYYGQSLMGTNGEKYIPRNIEQVASDMDHIKQISNHVKIYVNPFVSQNLPWAQQILQVAEDRGMHTVVNMMVDDRQLSNSNWNDYSARVVSACAALNGKADEILVGNEIILRSPMSKTEIKDKVVVLINDCKKVYSGEVSYEEFWWVYDVWIGYPGKIYLMQYEDLPIFQKHVNIMEEKFGSNARVGEWGEDLLDGSAEKDENWQKEQVELRYNMLAQTQAEVAYIFAYSEPSWNAFGITRPNGGERPVWQYLKSLGFGNGQSTPPPVVNEPTPPVNNTPPETNTDPPANVTTPEPPVENTVNETNTTDPPENNTTIPPEVTPPEVVANNTNTTTPAPTNSTTPEVSGEIPANNTNTTAPPEETSEEETQSSRRSGGGGGGRSSSFSSEDWTCEEWSECIDGEQYQICNHDTRSAVRTNTRECIPELRRNTTTTRTVVTSESSQSNVVQVQNETNVTQEEVLVAAVTSSPAVVVSNLQNASNSTANEITGAVVGTNSTRSYVWTILIAIAGLALVGLIAARLYNDRINARRNNDSGAN
jgi:hypothetical protein